MKRRAPTAPVTRAVSLKLDLYTKAALLIQRLWRRKFCHRRTEFLANSFVQHGPTVAHVKSIR